MDLKAIVKNLTPDAYFRLQFAAETGKWPDGTIVDSKQREHAIQACILYKSIHAATPELFVADSNSGEMITGVEAKKAFKKDKNAIPTRNLD